MTWLFKRPYFTLGDAMDIAEVFDLSGQQVVKLPPGFHVSADLLSIRKEGESLILAPIKPSAWPEGFFESIHIDDPAFVRPEQGVAPPAPSLD